MRLSDLRVGARLGRAFGLLLLLMLGMGLYALHKVEQVQANAVDLFDNWLPRTQSRWASGERGRRRHDSRGAVRARGA